MYCKRFQRQVHASRHARERMAEREISELMLSTLLEQGTVRYKDDSRLWIAMKMEGRDDNLICAAVTLEDKLIVKTVMHRFRWED
ncbi:MAG: DUF4258 domain-containing protein [Pseudomonadota bacterium]